MYRVFYQKQNKLGISLEGELKESEFKDVLRQIKMVCEAYPKVDILIDASAMRDYDPDLAVDTYDALTDHKDNIRKIAITSKNGIGLYFKDLFKNFENTEFKKFNSNELDKARNWVLQPDPTRVFQ